MIENLNDLKKELSGIKDDFVIWGTGYYGILLYSYIKQIGQDGRIKGFCDNASLKHGTIIYDKKICYSPQKLPEKIIILIGVRNREAQDAIAFQVTQMGLPYIDNLQDMMDSCKTELENKLLVKSMWYAGMGYELDLEHPHTFSEKLQCLKTGLYYNNPVITQCCDKVLVKKYIEDKKVNCKTAELYGVFDKPEDIEWDKLPGEFVIKCNHGCGYNIICKDKTELDIVSTVEQLREWLNEDYWIRFGEPQYKFIEKKILIEEYLGDDIQNYCFFCFYGEFKAMYIPNNRKVLNEIYRYKDFYNKDFVWQDITWLNHKHVPWNIEKPKCWDEMIKVSEEVSREFPFVRVDLYDKNGEVYLSELTFFPTGGYVRLKPDGLIEQWGEWLKL